MSFGNSAVTGPYGWSTNTQKRSKSTTAANLEPVVTNQQQTREVHTSAAAHHEPTPIVPPGGILNNIKRPPSPSPVQKPSSPVEPITIQDAQQAKPAKKSSLEEREAKKKQLQEKYAAMSDGELIDVLQRGDIKHNTLEDIVNPDRAVKIRRMFLAATTERPDMFNELPFEHYNYAAVKGKCCENVVGYVPIPVGMVGPFIIDGKEYHVPMATTEGTLLASTSRGAKAISMSGGANTVLLADGMTRGPVVSMPNAKRSAELKAWMQDEENYEELRKVFNSTSNYARLQSVKVAIAGKSVYIRFKCATGDAMGMNMISIAVEKSMQLLQEKFPDMEIKAVSGNFCTDKKAAAINWIEGRGKSVVCDAVISKHTVESVLKTNVDALVALNQSKNLVGSALAGSIGGYNAHSSNIVTAVFLATGQDPAQNVESSNCMTLMEKTENGDLYVSVTMPSIEVGTVGGGTGLAAQSACLNMLGVKGAHKTTPGQNAQQLAKIVSAMVMAGELSLMSALTTGDLVKAHKIHNRGTK